VPNEKGIDLLFAGGLCFKCDACLSLLGLNQVLGLLAEVLLFGLNEAIGLLAKVLLFWLNELLSLLAKVLLCGFNQLLRLLAKVPLFGLLEAMLFVDVDFLTDLLLNGTANSLFFVDANFLLVADVVTIGRRLGGSSKGFEILFFVTFPSDMFRLRR
jgi:hypothetical protein